MLSENTAQWHFRMTGCPRRDNSDTNVKTVMINAGRPRDDLAKKDDMSWRQCMGRENLQMSDWYQMTLATEVAKNVGATRHFWYHMSRNINTPWHVGRHILDDRDINEKCHVEKEPAKMTEKSYRFWRNIATCCQNLWNAIMNDIFHDTLFDREIWRCRVWNCFGQHTHDMTTYGDMFARR